MGDDRFGGDEALRAEVEDLFEGVQWLGSFEADSQRLRWVELASASKKRAGNLGMCCWCGALFEQRLQGNPRRFCSQRCLGRHNYAEQCRLADASPLRLSRADPGSHLTPRLQAYCRAYMRAVRTSMRTLKGSDVPLRDRRVLALAAGRDAGRDASARARTPTR